MMDEDGDTADLITLQSYSIEYRHDDDSAVYAEIFTWNENCLLNSYSYGVDNGENEIYLTFAWN